MRANAPKSRAAAITLSRVLSCVASTLVASASIASAGPPDADAELAARRLIAAYPEHLAAVEGATLVWRDGTRTTYDDGRGTKSFEEWLAAPDVEDMLLQPYPAGSAATPPPAGHDPGRARNAEFFRRIYGDCGKGGVERDLVDVVWLPRKFGSPSRSRASMASPEIRQARKGHANQGRRQAPRRCNPRSGRLPRSLQTQPETASRHVRLPRHCRHHAALRPWLWHRHRHRTLTIGLLALVEAGAGRRANLPEPHPARDRRGVRAPWLHLGRALASLRHHALRVPSRAAGTGGAGSLISQRKIEPRRNVSPRFPVRTSRRAYEKN